MAGLAGLAASACTTTAPVGSRSQLLSAADGTAISGLVYGAGQHGVVLVPGGHGIGASWDNLARRLATLGMQVLAIDYRGLGGLTGVAQDGDKAYLDVMGAIDWLRGAGAARISVVGASWGGQAAGLAALEMPGEIERHVFLAHSPFEGIERISGRKLFIVAREDRTGSGTGRLDGIRAQFDAASEPKRLVVLDGAAHAQFLFLTDQADRLYREIERFLVAR